MSLDLISSMAHPKATRGRFKPTMQAWHGWRGAPHQTPSAEELLLRTKHMWNLHICIWTSWLPSLQHSTLSLIFNLQQKNAGKWKQGYKVNSCQLQGDILSHQKRPSSRNCWAVLAVLWRQRTIKHLLQLCDARQNVALKTGLLFSLSSRLPWHRRERNSENHKYESYHKNVDFLSSLILYMFFPA